jgi:methylglutaconyl-CoA hydratase
MSSSENGYVNSSVNNGVATIEFFHPQRNSLPGVILDALAKAIEAAGADQAVKLIVLRSGGERIFCSGASFDELAAITTEADGLRFFSGFARVINAMRRVPQFIIARIQGKCVGGGVGIAAAADYAIAHTSSDIKLSELAVGIGPFVVGPAVERKIGNAAFTQLAIDAASFRSAEWALQKGLFAELHADMSEVDAAVAKLVQTLSMSSPDAMREIKSITWKGTEHWDELLMERAAISGRLILSEYSKNFIRQFKSGKP